MTFPEKEDSGPPSKRLKLDESVKSSGPSSSEEKNLLDFCDDLLLEIFSYLTPQDLHSLHRCCQRLERVARDRTLWKYVDLRTPRLTMNQIEAFVDLLLPTTKSLATRGMYLQDSETWDGETELFLDDDKEKTISEKFISEVATKSPNLTCFVFEDHVLDCEDIKFNLIWGKLPKGLVSLALRRCHLTKCQRHKAFFSGIYDSLPNLQRLDLSGCKWFQPHSFLALSKCKRLIELRLADCQLSDFVPYVSLGTRFGFQSLASLDLRRTWVSDREVSCFDKTKTLQELFLEAPASIRGPHLISDLGVTAFGGSLDEWNKMGYIVMFMPHCEGFKPSAMSHLELCNYVTVTDTSLRHCAACLTRLKRLNVKGTSVTLKGVIDFKTKRPDVVLESDFDELLPGSDDNAKKT